VHCSSSRVGGWAGIGLAAGLTEPTAAIGCVGGYAGLQNYTAMGASSLCFSLPDKLTKLEGDSLAWCSDVDTL